MALDTISDYVAQARILTQDTVIPYRYPDADLVLAFNTGVLESRRLRADMWLGVSPLPSFSFAAVNAATPSGNTLNFASGSLPFSIAGGDLVYDVTSQFSIQPGVTVNTIGATTIGLSGNVSAQVNSGDLIVFIDDAPVIDPQYRMAFVYYMCGQAQMRDEEETQDTRAAAFMAMFKSALLSV